MQGTGARGCTEQDRTGWGACPVFARPGAFCGARAGVCAARRGHGVIEHGRADRGLCGLPVFRGSSDPPARRCAAPGRPVAGVRGARGRGWVVPRCTGTDTARRRARDPGQRLRLRAGIRPQRRLARDDAALRAHQPPAPPQQERHRLPALAQIPQQPAAERRRGTPAQTQRVGQDAQLPAARHHIGREDALGDEQPRTAGVQFLGVDAGAGGDRVHRDGRTARTAQLLDRGDRRVRVPGQRRVPVDVRAAGDQWQRRIVALLVEVVETEHGQARAGGERRLAGAGGAREQDDTRGGGSLGTHGTPV